MRAIGEFIDGNILVVMTKKEYEQIENNSNGLVNNDNQLAVDYFSDMFWDRRYKGTLLVRATGSLARAIGSSYVTRGMSDQKHKYYQQMKLSEFIMELNKNPDQFLQFGGFGRKSLVAIQDYFNNNTVQQ